MKFSGLKVFGFAISPIKEEYQVKTFCYALVCIKFTLSFSSWGLVSPIYNNGALIFLMI